MYISGVCFLPPDHQAQPPTLPTYQFAELLTLVNTLQLTPLSLDKYIPPPYTAAATTLAFSAALTSTHGCVPSEAMAVNDCPMLEEEYKFPP